MHGLIMRALQMFVTDCHGTDLWEQVIQTAGLEFYDFETMFLYDEAETAPVMKALPIVLTRSRDEIMEDIGTYLVSHAHTEALRRLLRFGGDTFEEFLHSLDDLPDRARLAVSDLTLPEIQLVENEEGTFSLICTGDLPGWGHLMAGALRTMADDYGALALVEHCGADGSSETVIITLLEHTYTEGRSFDLGAMIS